MDAEYGLIVAKNSYVGHVDDANSSQLAIDTRLLVPKIHSQGSGTITSVTTGTKPSVTIPHGLGYAPDCEVYLGPGSTRQILFGDQATNIPFIVSINNTSMVISQTNNDSFSTLYNYYYYIFLEEA